MRGLAIALVSSLPSLATWVAPAAAEPPPPVKHAESVRVSVANRTQTAAALHPLPAGAGWRLDLAADAQFADVIDLTPGTPARTLSVAIVARKVRFDPVRFVAGHVYRVQLRGGVHAAASLVYLFPDAAAAKMAPAPKKGTQRVRFDADERPADDRDSISHVDKGSL